MKVKLNPLRVAADRKPVDTRLHRPRIAGVAP